MKTCIKCDNWSKSDLCKTCGMCDKCCECKFCNDCGFIIDKCACELLMPDDNEQMLFM